MPNKGELFMNSELDPNSLNKKEEKEKKLPKKLIATILAIAALALPLAGCGKAASTPSHTPSPNKTEQPSPSQSPTASPTTAEVSPSPITTPEKAPTQQEVDAYASWAEKYAGMDISTFEALPIGERLAYAQYLIDYTVAHDVYNAMYNNEYSSNGNYKITPSVASSEDTGENILLNVLYHEQLSGLQLLKGASSPTLDTTKAQEALSAVFYDVGNNKTVSKAYTKLFKSYENNTKLRVIPPAWTALHTSKLLNGHDSQGNEVQYKIVTFHDDSIDSSDPNAGKTLYGEFACYEFTSYNGLKKFIWLLDMIGISMNELKASETIQ